MEYQRFNNSLVVRLDKGEEVIEQIKNIVLKENIKLAEINALGATGSFTIGVYSVIDKQYYKKDYEGDFEIVSLHGNISTMNDEFYLHLHMSAGNKEGNVVGGHLNRCVISATCEMFINIIDGRIDRMKDQVIGLNTYKFLNSINSGYDDETIIERVKVGDRVKVRLLNYPEHGKISEDYGTVTRIVNGEWMQTGEESMDEVYAIFVACENTSIQPIAFNPKNIKKA